MQPYIVKNIRSEVDEIRQAVRGITEQRAKVYANMPSAVLGSVNNTEAVTDSYIYGNVIINGSARMHQCIVNKGVTVELEDGVIAVGCCFSAKAVGSLHLFGDGRPDGITFIECHIKIGKNGTLLYSNITGDFVSGEGLSAYASIICDQETTPFPKVVYGNNATICKSDIIMGRFDYQVSKDGEAVIGDNFFIYNARELFVGGEHIHIGNNFTVCEYKEALRMIGGSMPLSSVILSNNITDRNPMVTNHEYHHNPKTQTIGYFGAAEHDVYIGNDVYVGTGYEFMAVPKAESATIKIGDSSILCSHVTNSDSYYGPNQTHCFNFQVKNLNIGANNRLIYHSDHNYYRMRNAVLSLLDAGDDCVISLTTAQSTNGCCDEHHLKPKTIAFV